MVTRTVQIRNPMGLHARPAAVLLKEAKRFPCAVTLAIAGKTISVRSILALLSAEITCGSTVEIRCDGEREEEALDALCFAVSNGFGETLSEVQHT